MSAAPSWMFACARSHLIDFPGGDPQRLIVSIVEGIMSAPSSRNPPMTDTDLEILLGTLDVLVLKTLSWGPMHGYGIARWIRESSGQTFRILDGALYTSLHRLEERGSVEA